MDLSKLSDEDLIALKQGNYQGVSDAGLAELKRAKTSPSKQAGSPVMPIPSQTALESLGGVFKDMATAIMNPMDTAKFIGGMAEAGIEKINPFMDPQDYQHQQYPQAFGEMVKGRYGSPETAASTLKEDPFGALADVSGLVSGAGAATRIPALGKLGRAIDPVNAAINIPTAATTAIIPEGLPAKMYESAVKFPPVSVKPEVRKRGVETALREKIMPTQGGIERLSMKLDDFDARIDRLVKEADATGQTIPRTRIYSELLDLQKNLSQGAGAPKNIKKAQGLVEDLEKFLESGPDNWTPSQMQKFKTATYRDINWKSKPSAKTETMKSLARGARKSIADLSPELADVNRAYGPLAELRDILQQPAHRISNRNPMSIVPPLTATAGGAMGGIPGAVMGAGVGFLNNPQILSRMAIGLRSAKDSGIIDLLSSGSPYAQLLRQGLLQSGRTNEEIR